MRISRKCELVLLVSLLLVSLMALALVLNYSIWPSLPHEERVKLRLVPDARIMRYDTPSAINTKTHKFTERNKGITVRRMQQRRPPDTEAYSIGPEHRVRDFSLAASHSLFGRLSLSLCSLLQAPCWLSIDFVILLPDPSLTGGVRQMTSLLDLPYGIAIHGQPALNRTAACILARDFAQSLRDSVALYIDVDDQNNAFFNQSTGASTPDYSRTYDAHASPPGLVIMRSVGDGIRVGGGFLLTLCCVGIVLSAGMLGLRVWDDLTWSKRATLSAEGEGSTARRARQFSPLGAEDGDDSSSYRLATSPSRNSQSANRGRPSQSRSSRTGALAGQGEFHGDIELEEQRQRHERGDDSDHEQHERMERKYDDDDDADAALELEAPSHSSVNQAAFEPRSPVPRLQPPPPTSSTAGAADLADIDVELASFEEEMLRHQHELEAEQQAQQTQKS